MNQLDLHQFMQGIACSKSMFLYQHDSKYSQQMRNRKLEKNKNVIRHARALYEGGIDLSDGNKILGRNLIEKTNETISKKNNVLFNPAFESLNGKLNCDLDIMVKSETKIRFIIIKNSIKINLPNDMYELGFKWKILSENGYHRCDIYFLYLNKNYVADKEIDVEELFVLEKVTQKAKNVEVLIDRYLREYQLLSEKSTIPEAKYGDWCNECAFQEACWKNVPEQSVFNISASYKQKQWFYENGITDVSLIPRDAKLTTEQWIEVDATIERKTSISKEELKKFVYSLSLNGPINFLSANFFTPAIPILKGTHSFQDLCFQYCNLFRKDKNSELETRNYFSHFNTDVRRNFLENFIKDTENKGVILMYNKKRFVEILNSLIPLFLDLEYHILERIDRIKDLKEPFESKIYYHPLLKGKISIQNVYSVLCPKESIQEPLLNRNEEIENFENYFNLTVQNQILLERKLIEQCQARTNAILKIANSLEKIIYK